MTLTGHRCSERKQTEAALSEREAQLRDLFDNAPVGIFHSNLEGRMVEANPALASMLGYSSPDELTTAIADMTIQLYDDPELCPRIMAALLDSDGWVHYDDVVWRCRDNRRIRVDMTGRKVLDNTGAIAYLEGFIEDITERKNAEEEILRNNKRLQRLANILQHPSETIQEFLDYALEQALQLTDSKLGYIYHYHEDSREFVLNTWSRDVMPECAVVNPQTCYALDQTGIWGEAVRQRRPIVVNDFQVAHPLKNWRSGRIAGTDSTSCHC
jgi:two-component system, sensor histidine kinase and response regulator